MKILILDDLETRHNTFKKRYDGADLFHAWNSYECMDIIQANDRFDLIHLDHDLDHFVMGMYTQHEITGEFAARRIASLVISCPEKVPNLVIIHSWNPPGAANMARILREAGVSVIIEPFQEDSEIKMKFDWDGMSQK